MEIPRGSAENESAESLSDSRGRILEGPSRIAGDAGTRYAIRRRGSSRRVFPRDCFLTALSLSLPPPIEERRN